MNVGSTASYHGMATWSRGNCWDNACSKATFGWLKTERLHGQRFETRRQAEEGPIALLLWYSRSRLHSTLAYVSPMRFVHLGLPLRPSKPIRDSAIRYGSQGQDQTVHIETAPPRLAAIQKCVDDAAGVLQNNLI